MEQMLNQLNKIIELLEQILGITENQMTVLLQSRQEPSYLDMVEEMATLKGDMTSQIEQEEALFQSLYAQHKEGLQAHPQMVELQQKIESVLGLKERVIAAEQKNVMVLQEVLRDMTTPASLPKNPSQVTDAYKQYSKK